MLKVIVTSSANRRGREESLRKTTVDAKRRPLAPSDDSQMLSRRNIVTRLDGLDSLSKLVSRVQVFNIKWTMQIVDRVFHLVARSIFGFDGFLFAGRCRLFSSAAACYLVSVPSVELRDLCVQALLNVLLSFLETHSLFRCRR